ncbi:MAG: cytochrome b [Burkholderiales bacterium]
MARESPMNGAAYTRTAILLHWLTALLLIFSFGLGLTMVDMELSPQKLKLYSWHKWVGVTVFLVTAVRLSWRMIRPAPALPAGMSGWQAGMARYVHLALYALLFFIPISGWLFSSAAGFPVVYLGLIPLPDLVTPDKALARQIKEVHEFLAYGLATLIALHVGAALKHHFVERDQVLARMLPMLKPRK